MAKRKRKRGPVARTSPPRPPAKKIAPAAVGEKRPPRDVWIIGIIFLVAFLVRLVFLIDYQKLPFAHAPIIDAEFHDIWAQQILQGDIFSLKQGQLLYKAPFYPYFMALVFLVFGHSYVILELIQIILGSLSCVLIYLIGRRYFSGTASILAAAFYGLYFVAVSTDVTLEIPAVAVFLTLLSFFFLTARPGRWGPVASGLFLGFSILALPTNFLLVPYYGYVLYKRSGVRRMLAGLSVVVVLILPVTVRNLVVGRSLTVVSANNGINLFLGNTGDYATTTNIYPGLEWQVLTSEPRLKENIRSNAGQARYWVDRTAREVLKDPLPHVLQGGKKFVMSFMNYEVQRNDDPYFIWKNSSLSKFPFLTAMAIFPFALLGLGVFVKTKKKGAELIWVLGLLMIPSVLYFVTSRYRVPTMAFWALFAGFAAATFVDWIRFKRWKQAVAAAALLIAAAGFVGSNVFVPKNDPARHPYDLATCYYKKHNVDQVVANCNACLDLLNDRPEKKYVQAEMHWMLGNVFNIVGRYDAALEHLNRSLALFPTYGAALVDKGAVLLARREYTTAFDVLLFALNDGFFAQEATKNQGYYLFEETIRNGRPTSQMRDALRTATDATVRKILSLYL